MICSHPQFSKTAGQHPCGQCMECRINYKRVWAHRLLLEAKCHEFNSFTTLTLADSHLVFNNKAPILYKPDVQNFCQRLRDQLGPFRYYAVGEYGEQTQRPHYHLALFGVSDRSIDNVRHAWSDDLGSKGHVHMGTLTVESAQYICGYVTKKMTKPNDPRLEGREPEFALMSKGIGRGYLDVIQKYWGNYIHEYLRENEDVPKSLLHGERELPLGRYMVDKLRERFGVLEIVRAKNKRKAQERLQDMRYDGANPKKDENGQTIGYKVLAERDQRILNKSTLRVIKKKERKL